MPHYNLYESLGLNRQADSHSLGQQLTQRLQSGYFPNPGGAEEIKLALNILGNPQLRATYDAALDNVNGPTITVEAVRSLAASAAVAGAPRAPRAHRAQQGAFLNTTLERVRKADKAVMGGTALLTLLVVLLLWGVVALVGGGSGGSDSGGGYEGAVEKKASQFLALEGAEKTRNWFDDNALEPETLEVRDSYQSFSEEHDIDNPEVIEVINFSALARAATAMDGDDLESFDASLDVPGVDELYFVLIAENGGKAADAILIFGISDGTPKFIGGAEPGAFNPSSGSIDGRSSFNF